MNVEQRWRLEQLKNEGRRRSSGYWAREDGIEGMEKGRREKGREEENLG